MITKVTLYEAPDKKRFDTKIKAEEHILERVQEHVDNLLYPLLVKNQMKATTKLKVVLTLFPDYETMMKLYTTMSEMIIGNLNHIEQDEDE